MIRNPYSGEAERMREAVVRSTRGREALLSGPADERASGKVGLVTPGGEVLNFGLFDITMFGEGFRLA